MVTSVSMNSIVSSKVRIATARRGSFVAGTARPAVPSGRGFVAAARPLSRRPRVTVLAAATASAPGMMLSDEKLEGLDPEVSWISLRELRSGVFGACAMALRLVQFRGLSTGRETKDKQTSGSMCFVHYVANSMRVAETLTYVVYAAFACF